MAVGEQLGLPPRHVHALPETGGVPDGERSQRRHRADEAGGGVGDEAANLHRRPLPEDLPRMADGAGHGVALAAGVRDGQVLRLPTGVRPREPERGDRDAHESRIRRREGVEAAGRRVVDQDVGARGEGRQCPLSRVRFGVEDHAFLAGVAVDEETAALGVGAR